MFEDVIWNLEVSFEIDKHIVISKNSIGILCGCRQKDRMGFSNFFLVQFSRSAELV